MLALTRALLALRRAEPALHAGTIEIVGDGVPDDSFVFVRAHAGRRMVVALSFADEPHVVAVPGPGSIVASTEMDRVGERTNGPLRLRPHEGCIVAIDP